MWTVSVQKGNVLLLGRSYPEEKWCLYYKQLNCEPRLPPLALAAGMPMAADD